MEDICLLKGVNSKNMHAWEELYSAYYAALCSYTNSIISDKDAAEDIVQDILIAVWKSQRQFGDMRELTCYLYRACYNNALVLIRNNKIRRGIENRLELETCEDPEKMFAITVRDEIIRQLYEHIKELPASSREIMELSIMGFSGPMIADRLGITINTVKTQKNRGFKFLREKLKNSVLVFLI